MESVTTEENYLIQKVKSAQSKNPYAAKSWILAAKTLYPQNFSVQFQAYRLEKGENNFEEAAKCFSYIILTFHGQPNSQPPVVGGDVWQEISQLTGALRVPEGSTTVEQEFYVKMFQHMSYEVQQKILILTATHSDNNLEHCKLILLLLKRYPQTIETHSPRLIETLVQGVTNKVLLCHEMLVQEVIPLIMFKPPDLPSVLVNRVMAICFEYYINQMFVANESATVASTTTTHGSGGSDGAAAGVVTSASATLSQQQLAPSQLPPNQPKMSEATKNTTISENWRKLFEVLDLCGRILKWEPFLPYNRSWSKDIYWQKLIEIVSSNPPRPSENKQILFCATMLFVMALQQYIQNVKIKVIDPHSTNNHQHQHETDYILVQGFKDSFSDNNKRRNSDTTMLEIPQISVCSPCTNETPICLVTAAHCWQLLHSNDILKMDFSQLLMTIPLSTWINRFLLDLAIYLGRTDEAYNLLKETKINNIEKNVRLMSLNVSVNQTGISIQVFDYILKIFSELNHLTTGVWIKNITNSNDSGSNTAPATTNRHLILLPLTKRSIIQYTTKLLIISLKLKLLKDPNGCSDTLIGNLLVLLQLDWPTEHKLAEQIFLIISTKGQFTYLKFTQYIICIDLIEQFMSMWYPHGGDIHFELTMSCGNVPGASVGGNSVGGVGNCGVVNPARRIGTRGADKGVKDDFKLIMRQQILKCNDNIETIIQTFITQEHMALVQNIFDK